MYPITESKTPTYSIRLFSVMLFGVAMGYFEAMVVVYLRGLYYPGGFSFPLVLIPRRMIVLELAREAATIVMLVCIAALAARKFWERFAYFLIVFGVWDVFYYVWLKVAIDWPATIFDWDILFLIPLPWIGPVIAPSLVALLMIGIGLSITRLFDAGYDFRPNRASWLLAVAATVAILYSFMRDVGAGLYQELPKPYAYGLLFIGLILYVAGYVHAYRAVTCVRE